MISVCRQKTGSNQPYIFCLSDSITSAQITIRCEEFKNPEYSYWIQEVPEDSKIGDDIDYNPIKLKKDKPIDHYATGGKGSPTTGRHYPARGPVIPAVGSLIGIHKIPVPTYTGIGDQNQMHDPDNYDIIHTMEISPVLDVLLNGVIIASAPAFRITKGKEKKIPQPERARFCRGVIWWLMNDEICLKDKLSEIGYCAPVPVVTQDPDPIEDISIENITASIYPGPGIFHDCCFNDELTSLVDTENLKALLNEELSDMWIPEYDALDQDYQHETPEEIIRAFEPAPVDMIRQWSIPQLRITIQECVLA